MMPSLSIAALVCAAIPAALFLANLPRFRRLPVASPALQPGTSLSVLVPARNEQENISGILDSILASQGVDFEVVVLDDHSSDATADRVREYAARDPRVRLVPGADLPAGWCGKNFACHQLAHAARSPFLLFLDADVRLAGPDTLSRVATLLESGPASLISGVPRQFTGTWLERLIIPLIQFVLLGFLPFRRMQASADPRFTAACGQFLAARRADYLQCGGHESVKGRIHDAMALARCFRASGFRTDVLDLTDSATCRMYDTAPAVWRGFAKNAHEGLGAPALIGPMTALLLTGQVVPFVLLCMAPGPLAIAAAAVAWLPRFIGVFRFHQPLFGAVLHPLAMLLLLANQWHGLIRHLTGRPFAWKGRAGLATTAAIFLLVACSPTPGVEPAKCPPFSLEDQHQTVHNFTFPRQKACLLFVSDKAGSEQIAAWVEPLRARFGESIEFTGMADLGAVPRPLQGIVRATFRKKLTYPVLLDWTGDTSSAFAYRAGVANLYLITRAGTFYHRTSGPATPKSLEEVGSVIKALLDSQS